MILQQIRANEPSSKNLVFLNGTTEIEIPKNEVGFCKTLKMLKEIYINRKM